MRIAQVSPLFESVPPFFYGGTERIVYYLTEELIRQGHEVVLFAAGDSRTSAELVACAPQALRLGAGPKDASALHLLMLERVFARRHEFDMIHFHVDYQHFPMSRRTPVPHVTTMHGRQDLAHTAQLYAEYNEMPLVSISYAQRNPVLFANWIENVYHGLPLDLYRFNPRPEGYLAFLGRISPEKRLDRAIEVAGRAGLRLKVAAKIDVADRSYYEEKIQPMMASPWVEYVGEIGEAEKQGFLSGAEALLFPIDWPEPFGMVMIEALACGTPVIAFKSGSVPEVIQDGVTGYVVESIEEAVKAVGKLPLLSREKCRKTFEERFAVELFTKNYIQTYKKAQVRGRPRQRERTNDLYIEK